MLLDAATLGRLGQCRPAALHPLRPGGLRRCHAACTRQQSRPAKVAPAQGPGGSGGELEGLGQGRSETLHSLNELLGVEEQEELQPSEPAAQQPAPAAAPKRTVGERHLIGADAWRQQEEELEQDMARRTFLAGCLMGFTMTGSVFSHWLRQPGHRELFTRKLRRARGRFSGLLRSQQGRW